MKIKNKINLTPEANLICHFIYEFGCINYKQLDLLLGKKKKSKDYYINELLKKQMIKKSDDAYVPVILKSTYTKHMELCQWVLLKNLNKDEESAEEVVYMNASDPFQISFIKDDVLHNLMYVDMNSQALVTLVEQQFAKEFPYEKLVALETCPIKYVFVTDNIEVVEKIKQYELAAPVIIAHVRFIPDNIPEIDYYK